MSLPECVSVLGTYQRSGCGSVSPFQGCAAAWSVCVQGLLTPESAAATTLKPFPVHKGVIISSPTFSFHPLKLLHGNRTQMCYQETAWHTLADQLITGPYACGDRLWQTAVPLSLPLPTACVSQNPSPGAHPLLPARHHTPAAASSRTQPGVSLQRSLCWEDWPFSYCNMHFCP